MDDWKLVPDNPHATKLPVRGQTICPKCQSKNANYTIYATKGNTDKARIECDKCKHSDFVIIKEN